MNKREFVAGGMAAVVAAPALALDAPGNAPRAGLRELLTRTRRLPDLAGRADAAAFAAYVGERFTVVAGPGTGEQLVLAAVAPVARCAATEQFDVAFVPVGAARAPATADGLRLLAHATGQRLALHLERGSARYTARFNLLA